MRPSTFPLLAAAASLVAIAPAVGQADTASSPYPSCAEQGILRVAVMVPPGKTEAEIREAVQNGGFLPAGTEAILLQPGQLTRMRNAEQFGTRYNLALNRFLDEGIHIDGSLSILLRLDDSGNVVEVHPNSGNGEVNSILTRTWRTAKFEPYVMGGCRVPAWIQVPQNFRSDWDVEMHRVEVDSRPTPPPP